MGSLGHFHQEEFDCCYCLCLRQLSGCRAAEKRSAVHLAQRMTPETLLVAIMSNIPNGGLSGIKGASKLGP